MIVNINRPPAHLSTALKEATKPFLASIGCHFFQYLKVFKDGSFTFVTTEPTWDEFTTHLIQSTDKPAVYSHINGHTLDKNKFTFLWDPNLPKEPVSLAREFNIANGMTFVERHANYYYMFAFATPTTHAGAIDNYFNSLNAMHDFLQKFQQQQKRLIQDIDQHRFRVPKARQDSHLDKMLLNEKAYHLTAQETACIRGLAKGQTYKEIARALGISPRTVETYLQRVRLRYHLQHKQELIALL